MGALSPAPRVVCGVAIPRFSAPEQPASGSAVSGAHISHSRPPTPKFRELLPLPLVRVLVQSEDLMLVAPPMNLKRCPATATVAATVQPEYWGHFVSVGVAWCREPYHGISRQIFEKAGKTLKRRGRRGLEPATSDVTGQAVSQKFRESLPSEIAR